PDIRRAVAYHVQCRRGGRFDYSARAHRGQRAGGAAGRGDVFCALSWTARATSRPADSSLPAREAWKLRTLYHRDRRRRTEHDLRGRLPSFAQETAVMAILENP